ncbi:hypothetical protein B0H14DRAFT_2582226 [Mycena olivaceomarginata]|nr:hypothetical protein B0H14DRAFT_2582226 [Mycena olivaceomarginata]
MATLCYLQVLDTVNQPRFSSTNTCCPRILPTFSAIFNNFSAVRRHNTDGTHDARLLQVDDRAEDLAVLLSCLYYLNLPFGLDKPTVTVDLGALLRLCRKYQISSLAAKIIAQLKFEWPTSLSIYDKHETRVRNASIAHASAPDGQSPANTSTTSSPSPPPSSASPANSTSPSSSPRRSTPLSLISPSADYAALHARLRPDRATAQLARGGRSARWALLAPGDLLSLAKGQDQLRSHKTLTRAFETHAHAPACSAGWDVLLGALRELLERTNDVLGALTYLRLYVADQEKAGTARICPELRERGL